MKMLRPRTLLLAAVCALALDGCKSDVVTQPPLTEEDYFQYITVRRAWRPGERDSLAAYIVAHRSWSFPYVGDVSDMAPAALAAWDSTTDVIVNPLWRPTASAVGFGGFQYDATFTTIGMDIWIVFDNQPDVAGIQRDSLPWKMFLWSKGTEQTWKGFVIAATTANQFTPYRTIKTVDFNNAGAHSGQAAGEFRQSTTPGSYWEGDNGGFRLTFNGGYPTSGNIWDTAQSGVWTGGNRSYGLMSGNVKNLSMPQSEGPLPWTDQYFSATWTNVNATKVRCYFPPITPPSPFTSCTGSGFSRIVANARARRAAVDAALGGSGR